MKIGIVVGEASGDILGAALIRSLREKNPAIEFEGVAGPKMIAAGCKTLYSMDRLAVMGIVEPLKRLPELIKMRRNLYRHFRKTKPDIFIGIDAPDFNLGLELKLKNQGIKTVHYVSPSVWAWRKGRIHKIKRAVDLMLTLLPFEVDIYKKHKIPVQFVGHPLADQIPLETDQIAIRAQLNIAHGAKVLGILPGSRETELKYLAEPFILAAKKCRQQIPGLQIITSMINEKRKEQFKKILQKIDPDFSVKIFVNKSHEVMAAADTLLLASGTVTLEAMLLKRPMVVAYKMSRFHFFIAKLLIKIDYFSLPNLIANKKIVPEFLQQEATPQALAQTVLEQLQDQKKTKKLITEFTNLHKQIRQNASTKTAEYILKI
jgi:lipid-A-disaccharide synthase